MKVPRWKFAVFLVVLFGGPARATNAIDPAAGGPEPVATEISPLDALTATLQRLAAQRPVAAEFVESRTLPGRRRPITVNGTMRLDAVGGLSLQYPRGREQTILLADDDGLFWRTGRRAFRAVPAGRADVPLDLLRQVLNGQLAGVTVRPAEPDAPSGWAWTLHPESSTAEGDPTVATWSELRLRGHGDRLEFLELDLPRGVTVALALAEPTFPGRFGAEDRERFFRRGTTP